jgi:hypothetical protein
VAWRAELVAALGGEDQLSPQRRKLVEMTTRAALLLDHVDSWLLQQRSLVNTRSRTLVPVLIQRQSLADHLARLLDKLGLDRVPTKVTTLDSYIETKYGSQDGEHAPAEPAAGSSRTPVPRDSAQPTPKESPC